MKDDGSDKEPLLTITAEDIADMGVEGDAADRTNHVDRSIKKKAFTRFVVQRGMPSPLSHTKPSVKIPKPIHWNSQRQTRDSLPGHR